MEQPKCCIPINRYVFLWFICACFTLPLLAQTQKLNLYNAVQLSLENYPTLQQRRAEVLAGQAHVGTVKDNRLPSLILDDEFTMGTDNSLQGAYFSLGLIPSTPGSYTTVHNSPNLGNTALSFLKWEFLNFGYYGAQEREAKAQLAVNIANLESEKYMLTQNVVLLYLDWLKKYRLLSIEADNVERARVILTAIRANVISGLKPGVDSSTANAAFVDARLSYLQALNNYNAAGISIASYTGADAKGIIPDTLLAFPGDIPSSLQVNSSDKVAENHPLLDAYQKQYEQQLASNSAISKKYLPKVSLIGAGWIRSSGISSTAVYPDNVAYGLPYSKNNYLFGLNFSYNLFDIKRRGDELTEGKYAATAKQNMVNTQRVLLDRMVQQANMSYATTIDKLRELPTQLHSAQDAYGQQAALYQSGLNTLIEVTNAQYALHQAQTNFINTQNELYQLLYIRAALNGQSDNFLQNFKQ